MRGGAWLLMALGMVVMVLGLLDLRWGNASWRVRLLTGSAIAAGGLYLYLI